MIQTPYDESVASTPRYLIRRNTEFASAVLNGDETDIPEDWSVARIGETIRFRLGRTPKKEGDNYAGSVPWITISDIKKKHVSDYSAWIGPEVAGAIVPAGTLLGSFKMSVGRFAFTTEASATNEALIAIRPEDTDDDLEFLYHLLPDIFIGNAELNGQGIPLLNTKKIKELDYPRPPLRVQSAIASLLNLQASVCAKIGEAIASQEMALKVSRRRLVADVSNGNGWTETRIQDIAEIVSGQSPDSGSIGNSDGIEFHQGCSHFGRFVLHHSGKYATAARKTAPAGSILFSVRAPVGDVCRLDRKIAIGRGLAAIIPEANASFLYHSLEENRQSIAALGTGTTFEGIKSRDLASFKIKSPPPAEQKAISDILDAQLGTIRTLHTLLDTEKSKFQWLRRQLLSGKFDVAELQP